MRKTLLFMILFNSVTFVTNNLAMQEEEEKAVIEMSDLEKQAVQLESENEENKLSEPEDEPAEKSESIRCRKDWKSTLLKACCLCNGIIILLGATPAVSIAMSSASNSGIKGMVKSASPTTMYTGYKITEKLGCTYELLQKHDRPSTMCMNGDCKSNENGIYECTIEKCGENASSFEEECEQASWCGCCQPIVTLATYPAAIAASYFIGKNHKDKNS